MIGEVAADLCLPKLMSVIVDYGINASGDVSESVLGSTVMRIVFGEGSYTSMQVIITFGVLMLLVVLVGGFFGVFCAYTAAKASQGLGDDLRCDAYAKVMSLSIEQTDKFTTGSLVTRMTNDITMIVEFTEMILRMLVRSPMFFIGGTIMLCTLDLKFGFVLLCSLPIMAIMLVLVLGKAVPIFSNIQKKLDKVNSVVQENVSGARVVKAYVREDYEYERFKSANRELRDTNIKVQKLMAIMHPVLTVVMNAAVIAVILIGGFEIENVAGSGMSAGTIMAAVTYVTQVIMSIMMVTMLFHSVSRAMASVKRVGEVLDSDPVIVSGERRSVGDEIAVSFKGVDFRYPYAKGRPVLHDINIDIKKGETFAIIGETGSGKTSLVNLIMRFYDATEGEVSVNGVPVKEYDLSSLRSGISYVMQKSELFSGTIAENIRWGKADATDAEVAEAAKIAQAEEFINGFAEGYDTYIAEKGASLSGGQKQRMSIARALVRRPEIIILDDATSALDLATEAKLRKALRENLKDATVIMIAQRIASVKEADRIAVIENGTIKDCGSHDELMRTSETYRDIYNSQMNGADKREEVSL
ncbi:MAG: ABC transporter ATP-binding protein [Clostridia bacterium]|nr:ABC transporter ATP-binding protein [Clostridia bacterium]MBR2613042.1 ABC transporter ATP-binding protein [Clostridia bacterium]